MNKSQRIYLSSGNTGNDSQDKYIKIKLEQDVDTFEFMSLKLGTEEIYQNFNADYGVLVGRVLANNGIGIPNAKISVFIPLTDDDADDKNIYSFYPYKTPRDKNNEGKRYNLLPRVAKFNYNTNTYTPKQPFGSFPIKEEILGNESFLNVYKKYYKYTALTNNSGDYMIFGVPTGTQTIHLSVDITDIGKYSMNAAAMVTNLGYSPNLFTDGGTKIRESNDLNDLPNIETQEISVDIIPFWGDSVNYEIGITRQDFRIRSTLKNTFVIFGSVFTDGDNSMWGQNFDSNNAQIRELYRIRNAADTNLGMDVKRIGKVTEKIYYYPPSITDAEIDAGNVDPKTQMQVLDPSEYSVYKRNGDFVFIINCNRGRVITNEFGEDEPVSDDYTGGVYTKFRGFMTLEITEEEIPMDFTGDISKDVKIVPFRYKFKFPQYASEGRGLRKDDNDSSSENDVQTWRKQHFIFSGGGFYSISRFHGIVALTNTNNDNCNKLNNHTNDAFSNEDNINNSANTDRFQTVGNIQTAWSESTNYPINNCVKDSVKIFAANWLNFALYLPQVGYAARNQDEIKEWRSNTNFSHNFRSDYFYNDNNQIIAGNDFNTKYMARSDLHWTDFVYVPLDDITAINDMSRGFKATGDNGNILSNYTLKGKYRNGKYIPTGWDAACPIRGGKVNANADGVADTNTYFYKGFDTADCIEYLYLLGII